jgi:hypothetical protein
MEVMLKDVLCYGTLYITFRTGEVIARTLERWALRRRVEHRESVRRRREQNREEDED